MHADITIRRAETVTDYLACQSAQRLAWGIRDENYVVPVATMVGAQHHGGLVLGAFLPGGEAVGLSFSFLGKTEGRLCLYSQLTGVVPGYRDQGIGHRLKSAQREIARCEGLSCIAWAFDPLQAGNARFNLEKLGATAGRYIENMYGTRSDALNRNAPTDRLIAVWETGESPRPVTAILSPSRLIDPSGPTYSGLPSGSPGLLLEIPVEIVRLRAETPELAERWGTAVRQAFLSAFEAGYRAVGFTREEGRAYYLLERAEAGQ